MLKILELEKLDIHNSLVTNANNKSKKNITEVYPIINFTILRD